MRYYTDEHEWIDVEGDTATVGITEYAQEQLGDVVFVDVPGEGKQFDKGDEAAVVDVVIQAQRIGDADARAGQAFLILQVGDGVRQTVAQLMCTAVQETSVEQTV